MSQAFDNYQQALAHKNRRIFDLAKALMDSTGCSWDEAWNQVLRDNPTLAKDWTSFFYVSEDDGSISLVPPQRTDTADVAAKARADACSQVVQAVRRDHPALSFEEAWRIAAAENKQLFTPSAVGGDNQLSDEDFQKDYQLRVVYGLGKR